jgi:hypothetical protein
MATVLKFFAGDLGDIKAFFRCNLSEASAPLQRWDEILEQWVGTQFQCADAKHTTKGMVGLCGVIIAGDLELSGDEIEYEWEEVTGFREADESESHEDARGWYSGYGWHLSTRNAGDICHDAVEFDWLDDEDNTTVIERLLESDERLTEDEAETIVLQARAIRETGEAVEALLVEAVEHYENGDYQSCRKALDDCSKIESEHGDDPASSSLRDRLLDDAVAKLLA